MCHFFWFAGVIHTDFERGFICAEVMKFDELKELKTESAVKAAGKYRQEGKNYTVEVSPKIISFHEYKMLPIVHVICVKCLYSVP